MGQPVDRDTSRQKHKPPPNYFARSVQYRLLVAVASLMLVLALMFEARQPENWQWMWAGASHADLAGKVSGRPRSTSPPLPAAEENAVDRPPMWVWEAALEPLSLDERLVLDEILWSARRQRSVPSPSVDRWAPVLDKLLDKLTATWDRNRAETVVVEGELAPGTGRGAATRPQTARRGPREDDWLRQLRSALQAPLKGRLWTQLERDVLAEVQSAVDRFALGQVEDDTVTRAVEQHAWFRCFEQLRSRSLHEIEEASVGRVSFLQLFRQPAEYRGKIVTIRGSIRLAYRVPAPGNLYGIEHYYVFWLKPDSGQLAPYLVYSLQVPSGLPAIKDKYRDGATTSMSQAAEFTGYFFKRQAYRAKDGVNTAPVLLAKVPVLTSSPRLPPTRHYPAIVVTLSLVALAGLALGLTWLARGPRDTPRSRTRQYLHSAKLDVLALADRDHAPPVGEALRQLGQRQQHNERPRENEH